MNVGIGIGRIALAAWASFLVAPLFAQEPAELVVEPRELRLEVGETAMLSATVRDKAGNVLDRPVVFFSRQRASVGVSASGRVEAYRPGEHVVVCIVPRDAGDLDRAAEALLTFAIPVAIPKPPVVSVSFLQLPKHFYSGTTAPIEVEVRDRSGVVRTDVGVSVESSDPAVASAEEPGSLSLGTTGRARVTARAEGVVGTLDIVVEKSPAVRLELMGEKEPVRTGDVVFFRATAVDERGRGIPDFPIQYATFSRPANGIIEPGAIAQIEADGAFVAERPGLHTIVAASGALTARTTIAVVSRNVRKEVEVVGHGPVRDRHTSDLWVWEAPNGRDYAVTGTWGADGHAYFWDVTDPANIVLVDTVRVDARTVNDVKVSEDGRVAVISREGASNRKNGLVILDVSNPSEGVRVLSRYDDQLNGGVHNVFIADKHVYALSNGRRYDVISIEDPEKPYRVGRFELDTPGHSIHDVWVSAGIAYSSNWHDGIVAVDVGGGGKGGAPNRPVQLGSYAYPSGWNHAAFPYRSRSTGKFYVFAGDEAFPYPGDERPGAPERAAGWIHVVEWSDWAQPKEVARYEVPEAGTHNLWVEDDVLYVAYYNGGLRVVDVSGELRGDLYRQGREIASWHAYDPESFVPNAPFAWGPQPFKGHVFIADHESGLWAVKLVEPRKKRFLGEPTS
jgi:hypothetical protein